jgi:hypothetical protein
MATSLQDPGMLERFPVSETQPQLQSPGVTGAGVDMAKGSEIVCKPTATLTRLLEYTYSNMRLASRGLESVNVSNSERGSR